METAQMFQTIRATEDVIMDEVTLNQIRQIRYLGHIFGHAKYGQVGCP